MGNYPLSINYRCAKNILKTTSQLIEYNNPHRLEKKIEPYHKNPDGTANLYIGDELFKQMEWVIERIKEYKEITIVTLLMQGPSLANWLLL